MSGGEKLKPVDNPVEVMHDALLQIKKQKETFGQDLSTLDGAISDILHDLEREGAFDLYKGYLYAKRLQKLRKKRRDLKQQHEQIKLLEKTFNIKNSLDNMGRAMLNQGKEMPKKRNTREDDLLNDGSIKLRNGWKV